MATRPGTSNGACAARWWYERMVKIHWSKGSRAWALQWWTLGAVLVAAAVPRFYEIGRSSFWYDEVVTMRLARTGGPEALVELLGRIDATRAPLHPLMLQAWVRVFGVSEAAGRSFSAACGLLTVAMIYRLARRAFNDPRAGLAAAWLAALSPQLVYYSREVRMYALLVLLSCAAWDALFALKGTSAAGRLAWYAATLAALVYTHPLGLFMAGALGLAALLFRRSFGLSWARLLAAHLAAAAAVTPWLPRYFDHAPDFLSGALPLRFLLGTPIGFIGGNFLSLGVFAALAVYGAVRVRDAGDGRAHVGFEYPVSVACFLLWLTLPPVVLYVYSLAVHPVFGPPRYTLFVAPAYLVLVGRGVARLPPLAGAAVAVGAAVLSVSMWPRLVYAHDAKADWRAAAAVLDLLDPVAGDPVVVIARGPTGTNFEDDTARYYLGRGRPVIAMPDRPDEVAGRLVPGHGRLWFAVGVRDGRPIVPLPQTPATRSEPIELDGLRIWPVDPRDLP